MVIPFHRTAVRGSDASQANPVTLSVDLKMKSMQMRRDIAKATLNLSLHCTVNLKNQALKIQNQLLYFKLFCALNNTSSLFVL